MLYGVVLKALCGNGISRNVADSLSISLPSSQMPYLALVAASFVAPAAADAFVLVFSSDKRERTEQSHGSKCNNFVSLQNSLQT